VLADAGSTPAASTISFNVVDQHRPPNPMNQLGFRASTQFSPLALNSPYLPLFGHSMGTRPYTSVILLIHISTWNEGIRRVYSAIPCGYVGNRMLSRYQYGAANTNTRTFARGVAALLIAVLSPMSSNTGLSPVFRTFT